jgi:AsmA protein
MKKLLIGVGIVVVLLIVAVVALPFLIPVNTYRDKLVAAVKQSTGRDLAINGKVAFALLPTLGFEANDVAFSNAPGADAKSMAKLAKLQVAVKLMPLLRSEVEIDKLVLVDPDIALEIDKQGKPNWQFAQAPAAGAPAAPKPGTPTPAAPADSGKAGSPLGDLRLDDVRLENGHITYIDHRTGEKQELSAIGMKLSLPGLDSPFNGAGGATWHGEKMALTVSVGNPRALMDGKTSALGLKIEAKPVNFDFKGESTSLTPLKMDGAVNLQVPSIRGLAQWAGSPLNAPGTGFGPLSIAGKVAMAGSKMSFTDAAIGLDNIKAKGEVTFDSAGVRPSLKGKLDVDRLDVNPYLPPEGAKPAGAPAPAATGSAPPAGGPAPAQKSAEWSDAPLDLAALKTADVEFALSAGSILYRKIQIGKSALGLHLKDGHFEADLTELALYKGAGKGKVVLDGSGAVPGLQLDFNLAQMQLEPLLKDAVDFDKLTGTGAFDMSVGGKGKSERELVNALAGKGSINFTDGTIKGLDLVAMVKNLASALQAKSGSSQTNFSSLTGSYVITNGVLKNNDLLLKSEVSLSGAGTVDLPHKSVDYKLTPPRVGGVTVPIVAKGPWDNISYQPDLAGIVDPSKLLEDPSKLLKDPSKLLNKGGAAQSPPAGKGVDNLLQGIIGGKKQ